MIRLVVALSLFAVSCVAPMDEEVVQEEFWSRHWNFPAQLKAVEIWDAAGMPSCDEAPSFLSTSEDQAWNACKGRVSCHKDGDIYLWFGLKNSSNVLTHHTFHWLLHCVGMDEDPYHSQAEFWSTMEAGLME